MNEKNKHIVILGGGLNGLFLCYFLRKKYHYYKITIIEKAPQVGGLIETQKVGTTELERFYHHVFLTDKSLLEISKELDLENKLDFKDSSIANLNKQIFQPFVTPKDLLTYKGLSFFTKLRVGIWSLLIQLDKNGDKYIDLNAKDWITKKMGKEAWDGLWGPLFVGKFHDYADNLSLSFLWTRLHVRANSKETGKEKLGYMKGSFSQISKKMVALLPTMDINFLTSAEIKQITKKGEQYVIETSQGDSVADTIISTFSPLIFKHVFKDLIPEEYLQKINSVKYLAVICPTLFFKEQVTPYYWTNILDNTIPFKAIVEHTNLFDYPEYQGNKIVYLSHYLRQDDPLLQKDDAWLKNFYTEGLSKAVGRKLSPYEVVINKAMYAQPVFTLDMAKELIDFKTPMSGIYQCNMVSLLPMERGINSSIYIAEKFVNSINL